MRERFLPFSPPSIGEEELAEIADTLRSDWITTGPKVRLFEERFAERVGADAALAVSSCTAALHLSLVALGVGEGDVVITTPMTFCSTVNVIEHTGARPLLVDVEPDSLSLDPALVENAAARVPEDIKAILPVHYAGHPCDLDAVYALARGNGWAVVEDAAHAFPAAYRGAPVGAAGDGVDKTVCFSFYATKNVTTAEGGMLVGSPELIDEARMWSLHGMTRDAWKRYETEGTWYYEVVRPGYKYNMTDIQAAMGLQQLAKVDAFHARRLEIVARYDAAFEPVEELEVPVVRVDADSAWHLYVLRLDLERLRIGRARFIEEMKARNIGASVHFIPVHMHPYYRERYGFVPDDFPVARRAYERLVSIPLHPRLTDADVDDVIEAVSEIVAAYRL